MTTGGGTGRTPGASHETTRTQTTAQRRLGGRWLGVSRHCAVLRGRLRPHGKKAGRSCNHGLARGRWTTSRVGSHNVGGPRLMTGTKASNVSRPIRVTGTRSTDRDLLVAAYSKTGVIPGGPAVRHVVSVGYRQAGVDLPRLPTGRERRTTPHRFQRRLLTGQQRSRRGEVHEPAVRGVVVQHDNSTGREIRERFVEQHVSRLRNRGVVPNDQK